MPSSPKIPKETILETAFQLLIREGYQEVNIKKIANDLNSSTQPISWQFKGMENFRKELLQYCIRYVNERFTSIEGDVDQMLDGIVAVYIDLAYDTPNLYNYLYMEGTHECRLQELAQSISNDRRVLAIRQLTEKYGISAEAAERFMLNVQFYAHGIAAYITAGFLSLPKQTLLKMIQHTKKALLDQEIANK